MKNNSFSFLLLMLVITACHKTISDEERLVKILDTANDKGSELKKCIKHYSRNPADSLKLKASKYLIINMFGKKSSIPNLRLVETLFQKIDTSSFINDKKKYKKVVENAVAECKSYGGSFTTSEKILDLNQINANYLINHIDAVFKIWFSRPWHSKYTFQEFCEYVLPYRFLDEELSHKPWIAHIHQKYAYLEDSIKGIGDPVKAAMLINDHIVSRGYEHIDELKEVPLMNIEFMDLHPKGICEHRIIRMLGIMRSFGIPVALDQGVHWTKYPKGHNWNIILDLNKKPWSFLAEFPLKPSSKIHGEYGSQVFPFQANKSNPLIKVFRSVFTVDFSKISKENNYWIEDPSLRDVTNEYIFPKLQKVVIKSRNDKDGQKYFLMSFDRGMDMVPVEKLTGEAGDLVCYNIAKNHVGIPAKHTSEGIKMIGQPLIFDDSLTELKPNYENKQTLILERKFPISGNSFDYMRDMIGSEIQGSDDASFTKYELFGKINKEFNGFGELSINLKKPIQFVRFKLKNDKPLNISELQFFQNNKQLLFPIEGKPFGSIEKKNEGDKLDFNELSSINYNNAFDNEIKTNFVAPSGSFIGVDFGKKKSSGKFKIKYLGRNDQNIIEKNHQYELFYFDLEWKSIGMVKPMNYKVIFKNVPSNCLYLLKDLTGGADERIFTYKDNQQVFW